MSRSTGRKKFYAVKRGHKPGIYTNWVECRTQVEGFSRAVYAGFSTLREAEAYLNGGSERISIPAAQLEIEIAVSVPQFLPGLDQGPPRKMVTIYADGACSPNPGPGGYGTLIIHEDRRKELSAGFRLTTNNRMEILGCIAGLMALTQPCDVMICSDSKYVVDAMSKSWALRWRKHGWKRREKTGEMKEVLNVDLWIQMLDLCDRHRVRFNWVRGHSGNAGNERCDQLARAAAVSEALGIDSVYENPPDRTRNPGRAESS
jgi:ribonuclease HI